MTSAGVYTRATTVLVALATALACLAACGCSQQVHKPANTQPAAETAVEPCGPTLTKLPDTVGGIDFAAWRKRNSDMVGWLKIEGTNIDNVVVQTDDNDYYLHYDVDKQYSYEGTLFMDFENDRWLRDYNTIFYGHHMANGSMFRDIARYTDPAYLKAHSKITFVNHAGVHKLKPFYCWAAPASEDMNRVSFKNVKQFRSYWKKRLKKKKLYNGVKLGKLDHIFTFYTCSYQGENYRTILLAAEM